MKKLRRLMCIIISAAMFLGTVNLPNVIVSAEEPAAAEPVLENIAPDATITSAGGTAADHIKLVDESYGAGFSGIALIRSGTGYDVNNPGWAEFAFGEDQDIKSIEVILELNATDPSNFKFTYNLKGKKSGNDAVWEDIVLNQVQTRVTADYIRAHTVGKDYSTIRFELLKVENTANASYNSYAIAELRILSEVEVEEKVNIAPQATITSTDNNETEKTQWTDGEMGAGDSYVGFIKGSAQTENDAPAFAKFAYSKDMQIDSVEIVFPNVDSETSGFKYYYNLLGQKYGSSGWTTIAADQMATRVTGENVKTHEVNAQYSAIKLDVTKVENTLNPSYSHPGIQEFKIFGKEIVEEEENIAALAAVTSTGGNAGEEGQWTDGSVGIDEAYVGFLNGSVNQTDESKPAVAQFAYDTDVQIDKVEIVFPHITGTADGFKYYYNLVAQKSGQSGWTTIASNQMATRNNDDYEKSYDLNDAYSIIKLEVTKVENTLGNWYYAGIQEFRIFGKVPPVEGENIASKSGITSSTNDVAQQGKWIDGDTGTGDTIVGLLNGSNTQTNESSPAFAQFTYEDVDAEINRVEIAFEEVGESDSSGFEFTYNLLGQKAGSKYWDTLAANQTATRTTAGSLKTHVINGDYSIIRLEITKVTATNTDFSQYAYPAMTEIRIFGKIPADYSDSTTWENIIQDAVITSSYNNSAQHEKWIDGAIGIGDPYVGLIKNGAQSDTRNPAYAQFTFAEERDIASVDILFEEIGTSDANHFNFSFELLGQKAGQTGWETIANKQTATRVAGENTKTYPIEESYKAIRINVLSLTYTGGTDFVGKPGMVEFRIFSPADTSGVGGPLDPSNIAQYKPVHAQSGHSTQGKAVDGSAATRWMGGEYPAYFDIDLEENYNIDEIIVFTPTTANTQYSIYTSMDGVDYDLLLDKDDNNRGSETGDIHDARDTEARIVRVYVEYNSASANATINDIKVTGTKSNTAKQTAPAIDIEDYDGSSYDVTVTEQDAIEEVQGIVERNVGGEYVDWFEFDITAPGGTGYDFYEITNSGDKIKITGNSGVSLATGLNHYLKYYCNVHISQSGNQINMPDNIVPVEGTVHKETAFPIRYSYNYCTFSYTMAFWGEEEWRKELDWLALSGVNLVLDITAQEEVWRRFLTKIGYEHQDIKDFIVGPAFYGWTYMSNMYTFGGPIHDSWFEDRTELARTNQLIMRKLGMTPVLQGYSGMVPVDIANYDESIPVGTVIPQGMWCGTARPSMLRTGTETFNTYVDYFYEVQEEVYGDITHYYATDPFHEGGRKDGLDEVEISETVMESMLAFDPEAIWVIQAWTANPTLESLRGLENYRENTLILDLHAEKNSRSEWDDTNAHGKEFQGSPWVYCMLNNFGGRTGLRGSTENWVPELATLRDKADHVTGIGIIPEGSHNNPFLYDLFFEVIWGDDADNLVETDMDEWIKDYTTRRYGAESESAAEAWEIINAVAYKEDEYATDQSSESIFNARPSANVTKVSPWGSTAINIDAAAFKNALDLLLKDYYILKDSDAYLYDVVDVMEQSLTHETVGLYNNMKNAFNSKNLTAFNAAAEEFLAMGAKVEKVLGTRKEFMVGTWLDGAKNLSADTDDFTKRSFDINARALITTWGAYNLSNVLNDYATKQWAGLTEDYFLGRWNIWIEQARKNIQSGGAMTSGMGWFPSDWQWVLGHDGEGDYPTTDEYPTEPTEVDLFALAYEDAETSVTLSQTGEYAKANYVVRNDSGEDVDVLCIAAAYDFDGKLVEFEQIELPLDANGVNTTSIELPFDAARAEAFIWNADTLVPICGKVSLDDRIAAHGTATSSGNEAGRDPKYALDGDMSTRWATPTGKDNDWLLIDLGAEYDVDELILTWEAAYSAQYRIEVATAAAPDTFTTAAEITDGDGGTDTITFDTPVRARYIKWQGVKRGSPYGNSLWEFEIYGKKAALSDGE